MSLIATAYLQVNRAPAYRGAVWSAWEPLVQQPEGRYYRVRHVGLPAHMVVQVPPGPGASVTAFVKHDGIQYGPVVAEGLIEAIRELVTRAQGEVPETLVADLHALPIALGFPDGLCPEGA